MARRAPSPVKFAGDFPCEAEIARRLSQDPKEWAAKALILERNGLPPIDPLMGGRHWPSVRAFFHRRAGLSSLQVFKPDGEEDLNAL